MKIEPLGPTKRGGSVGRVTVVQVGDTTIVRSKRDKLPKDAAMTYGQREAQARYATLMQAYRVLKPLLARTLLKTKPMQRTNGLFLQANQATAEAFLTKREGEQGASLLQGYEVARGDGSVPSLRLELEGPTVRTDIAVGSLELTEQTSVNELTMAITRCNPGFTSDDALVFVRCRQREASEGLPERFTLEMYPLVLGFIVSQEGDRPVRELLPASLVTTTPGSDGNLLALSTEDGTLVTAIHSRWTKEGRVVSGNQRLVGRNPLAERLADPELRDRAVRSYGRIKEENLFRPAQADSPEGARSLREFFGMG